MALVFPIFIFYFLFSFLLPFFGPPILHLLGSLLPSTRTHEPELKRPMGELIMPLPSKRKPHFSVGTREGDRQC